MALRRKIAFQSVNASGTVGYDPALQRHHILPKQLRYQNCFAAIFDTSLSDAVGFDDFRLNGLLLPARDRAAVRMGLPLHRGPHCHYNGMVIERVGQIEQSWSRQRLRNPEKAQEEMVMRLRLLQRALRRRLLDVRRRLLLNRFDPLGRGVDFGDLDAMAESLWGATAGAHSE